MSYQSQRERIKRYIEDKILPYVKKKDLSYYKVVNGISGDLGVSISMVEDVLKNFIDTNKIKEIRQLTIQDHEIPHWMEEEKERAKSKEEEQGKMDDVIEKIEEEVKEDDTK